MFTYEYTAVLQQFFKADPQGKLTWNDLPPVAVTSFWLSFSREKTAGVIYEITFSFSSWGKAELSRAAISIYSDDRKNFLPPVKEK